MEGLEISEINFNMLNTEKRFDPEYFIKKNILLFAQLKKRGCMQVHQLAYVTDGIHTSIDYSEDSNINLISATSPKENIFDLSRQVFISRKSHEENPRTSLKVGDVIISTVGTIGNCAVVDDTVLPANSDRHVGIIRVNSQFSPYFISTFLLSKYGKFQTLRESTGNVQLNLFLYKIRELLIFKPSEKFQTVIQEKIINARSKLNLSKQKYIEAENLLLEELGLKELKIEQEKTNIKSFKESFGTTGRLDAEYYQPKYEATTKAIKHYKTGFEKLIYFVKNYSTGYPYKSDSYVDNGIPLIRINNIKQGILDLSNCSYIPKENISLSPKDIANDNDILISMSGTIGSSCKIPTGITAVINQRIMRISVKNFNVDALPLIINSIIGKNQLEQIGTGGVQTNISSRDILEILIPKIEEKIQSKIASFIQKSLYFKAESERLLEIAKRAVEIAIEEDENAAVQYINQNADISIKE